VGIYNKKGLGLLGGITERKKIVACLIIFGPCVYSTGSETSNGRPCV